MYTRTLPVLSKSVIDLSRSAELNSYTQPLSFSRMPQLFSTCARPEACRSHQTYSPLQPPRGWKCRAHSASAQHRQRPTDDEPRCANHPKPGELRQDDHARLLASVVQHRLYASGNRQEYFRNWYITIMMSKQRY
jgi:hypothetical protein